MSGLDTGLDVWVVEQTYSVRTLRRARRPSVRDNIRSGLYPQVFGKYVLERELARGGMARVVLATLRGAGGFEKKLVVKQIRDELAFDRQFVRRFVEEAKTTVALSHPNIVPVYELGVEQGVYFLSMELVEGVSVAELLGARSEQDTRSVLTPEEGAYVGVEVCRALEYAHRRMNVVHRDITPRNVMIDEEGQIKLIDFGIAAPALVSGQEILGSPGHMAPEQVDGGELGPPTDIFAVAVLLMEAWTATPPFRRATPEACAAAVRERHPRPSDFDPRLLPLDEAIARAMSIDPRARQPSAGDLARELRAFLHGVDAHDVARALGHRVRAVREAMSAPSSPPPSAPRATLASHGDLGTTTFAAREDAKRWTSPPSRGRADDPAMTIPTPLMVEVDELERIHADIAAARAKDSGLLDDTMPKPRATARVTDDRDPRPNDVPTVRRLRASRANAPLEEKVESIATRPLETPVGALDRAASTGKVTARSKGLLAVSVVVLVVSAFALAAWRARVPTADGPPASLTTAVMVPASSAFAPVAVVATASVLPSTIAPPISASTSSVSRASESAKTTSLAAPPSTTARAIVSLLGDPGTRVSVDGISRGACPARVPLEQGSHEVRFTFEPTGESRGERLSVKSGDHVTVKAEFTGVAPRVRVLR